MMLSKNVSLTCDSWFGIKNWLKHYKSISTALTMHGTQVGGLWQLFNHNLKQHEYRTFTNNKLIINVFQDKKLLKTISTVFKIDDLYTIFKTSFEALETNIHP